MTADDLTNCVIAGGHRPPLQQRGYHNRKKPDSATEIVRELRSRGREAYLVGGCVRDMVMAIEPPDYDIATSARPEEIVEIFPRTESIGAQFGVILVIYRGQRF